MTKDLVVYMNKLRRTTKEKEIINNEFNRQFRVAVLKETLPDNQKDIIYKKTSKYVSIQIGNSIRRWVCRIFVKQNQDNQFILHRLADYDCDFDFQTPDQLNLIKDHILYVADLCSKL